MSEQGSPAGAGFSISPLSRGKALALFAVLYAATVVVRANLTRAAVSDVANYWPVFLVIGLPAGLIVLRMLWNILAETWFAAALGVAAAGIAIGAAVKFPGEAAYAAVYHGFAFTLLLAVLAVSVLALILRSPWDKAHLPSLALEAGLVVALVGAFANIYGRVNGTVKLTKDQPQSAMTMRDYCLTLVSEDGKWTKLTLPGGAAGGQKLSAGALAIDVEPGGGDAESGTPSVELTATDGSATRKVTLFYDGGFVPLEVGAEKYRAAYAPTRLALPFEMVLEYGGEDSVVNAAPRPYDAGIAFRTSGSENTIRVNLKTGARFSLMGYRILLASVERPSGAVLAVSRNPWGRVFLFGIAAAVLGLVISIWVKWIQSR
jgi:hypothetical protein